MLNQTLKLDILGMSHQTIDGKTYCSVYASQLASGEDKIKYTGIMPMKLSCDPAVANGFNLPDYPYPCDVEIQVTMAGGGKMGQRVVGIKPAQNVKPAPQKS